MDDQEDFDRSTGLHFSIDFELNNRKLTQKQRDALRKVILDAVTGFRVRVQLMGVYDIVSVDAEEVSSSYGRRRMHPPIEETME